MIKSGTTVLTIYTDYLTGFLAEYVLGKDIETCVNNGMHAAHMIIQVSGCNLPEHQ